MKDAVIRYEHGGAAYVASPDGGSGGGGGEDGAWTVTRKGRGVVAQAALRRDGRQLIVVPLEGVAATYAVDVKPVGDGDSRRWVQVTVARDAQAVRKAVAAAAGAACCAATWATAAAADRVEEEEGGALTLRVRAPAFDAYKKNHFALRFPGDAGDDDAKDGEEHVREQRWAAADWNGQALARHMRSAAAALVRAFEHGGMEVDVPGVRAVRVVLGYPTADGTYRADFGHVYCGDDPEAARLAIPVSELLVQLWPSEEA